MGQTKSKPFPSLLTSNSWRRLSDSDCLHLLSHPEYFDNQLLNIEQTKLIRRSGSISTFFDTAEPGSSFDSELEPSLGSGKTNNNSQNLIVRSISMASSTIPLYRNSMYPGCIDHHSTDNCIQDTAGNSVPLKSEVRCSPPPPPLPLSLTSRIRPISMFPFDSGNNGEIPKSIVPTLPLTGDSEPSGLKQVENLNLSLNALLEQVNTTELVHNCTIRMRHENSNSLCIFQQDDDDRVQTLIPKHVNEQNDNDDNVIDDVDRQNRFVEKLEKKKEQMDESNQQCHQHRETIVEIRCSGLDCMCDRCIQNRFKLLNWLLPNCTRMNSERLLSGKPDGTFLVRKSEKFPGQYTLSFVCRRAVRHCLIMRSVYGFGLRWPYSFETLQQVIIHYSRHSLTEFNSKLNIRLKYPVFSA